MSTRYQVEYSPEALDDLKAIYSYIAFHLKERETAELVFYLCDQKKRLVSIVRIFYGGRDVENIIREER